jgi:8-oxo-dGTP pyrophosphatase MutT (NUDIX family)
VIERIDLARVREALAGRVADLGLDQEPGQRHAGVAVILRDREDAGGAEVLLIRRASRAGDPWSGHMAFPGGRREPQDADPLETALRETREEIGLDLAQSARFLAPLESLQATTRGKPLAMHVVPFVFELLAEPALTLNEEVAEVIWAPLAALARGELATTIPYHHEGQELKLPAWDVDGRIVWGMTYQMLQTLFALTHPGVYKP